MAEAGGKTRPKISPQYDLNAKLNACLDLAVRRTVSSSLAAAFTGLLLFRSPVTRWASVAFGAGVGIGSAYIESSYIFGGSPPKWSAPKVSAIPPTTHVCAIPPHEEQD